MLGHHLGIVPTGDAGKGDYDRDDTNTHGMFHEVFRRVPEN
jgi:hypothetical protein